MQEISITMPAWLWITLVVNVILFVVYVFSKGTIYGLKKAWRCLRPDEPFPTAESIRRRLDEATHA